MQDEKRLRRIETSLNVLRVVVWAVLGGFVAHILGPLFLK